MARAGNDRRPGLYLGLALALLVGACQSAGDRPADSSAVDPADFVGRTEAEVVGALGRPDSERAELDARVWQFAGPDCVVDIFLYPEGGTQVVAHAEARTRATGAPVGRCAVRAG